MRRISLLLLFMTMCIPAAYCQYWQKDSIYIDTSTVDFSHLRVGQFVRFHTYFDLDQYPMREESRPTVDSIARIIIKGTNCLWEIGYHTDCRASIDYNFKLSQTRADTIVNYIISKGVDPARVKAHGYGESRLLNNCSCEPNGRGPGRDCTEAEHAINRRVELTIIKLLDSEK